jgi:type I restriction enzyme, S subunit
MLKVGDLVLAMDRPIISTGLKLARVNEQDVPCVLVQRVCKFNCTPSLSKDFLFLVLQGTAFINHLGAVQNGSGVPHISGAQILSFKLQLPSADEQTEIVRRVETLFAFADRLEARLAQAQTAATRLTPALLAKAFRGELVPQDPNDEPAAELLRRLQAQRASGAPAPKTGAGRGRGRKAVLAADL